MEGHTHDGAHDHNHDGTHHRRAAATRSRAVPTAPRGQDGNAQPPTTAARYFPAAAADDLEARAAGGASPATVRTAHAAVAKSALGVGARRSHGVCLCKDVLRRIGHEGRDRGRGQIAGIGWAHAGAAAWLP